MKTTATTTATTATTTTLAVKGTTTVAEIAHLCGAKADGHAYTFKCAFELTGQANTVSVSAQVSNEDKERALAVMTPAQRAAVAEFDKLCKEHARARVTGLTSTREVWNGFAKAR